MSCLALTGARILTPAGWLDRHAVLIEQGRIAALVPSHDLGDTVERQELAGGMLLPGFIDVQVNGGGGVLFNDRPDVEGVAAIAAAHRRFGTTSLLPTLISDDLAVVAEAIEAVRAAIERGVPGVAGIHLEGPFLNPDKRGIHDASKFARLDASAIDLLASLPNGVTLVTLAPERAEPGVIRELVGRGVVVAAGHTMADYDTMQRAAAEGLSGVTHLFNASSQLEGRAPGVVGAALDLGLTCGLIVDGHHVHPASLRVAIAAAGLERMMLVTDAMPSVGMSHKNFTLGGRTIVAEDGALRAADGTLAGSDLDMALAVRNAVTMLGLDLAAASRLASRTPAAFLGLDGAMGVIAPGARADLVHLDEALRPLATWIGGSAE
jgi:N-acetylglucosamine-6-phosphate deacetylase